VALLDLNSTSAEAPLFLDLAPKYGWDEAVSNLARLDGSFLAGLMTRHDSGLHLLAAPVVLDMPIQAVVGGLTRIVGLLRSMYDVVVIDGGDYLDEIAMRIAELSDVVLFIAAQNVAYLSSAGKFLRQLRRSRVLTEDCLRVVVNRYHRDSQLPDESILSALGKDEFLKIPDDYPAALGAINRGRFLAESAPRSPATRAIAGLAATLAGERGFAVKRTGFLGLDFLSRPRELRRKAG
jgi:pilus assembly protein CpaE